MKLLQNKNMGELSPSKNFASFEQHEVHAASSQRLWYGIRYLVKPVILLVGLVENKSHPTFPSSWAIRLDLAYYIRP